MADTVRIDDIEVLATGVWNGESFTAADLAAIVKAFNATHAELPPRVQLGHDAKQEVARRLFPDADVSSGFPALGKVDALKVVGDKLLASFLSVPAKLADGIKSGRWIARSGGLFKNARVNGKTWPWLLDHVALLGDEAPAVAGLADIGLSLDVGGMVADGLMVYSADIDRTPAQVEAELNRIDDQLQAMAARVNELTRGRKGNPIISTRFRSLREEIRRVVNLTDDGGNMPDVNLQTYKDATAAIMWIAAKLDLDPADLDGFVAGVLERAGVSAPPAADGTDPAADPMAPDGGMMSKPTVEPTTPAPATTLAAVPVTPAVVSDTAVTLALQVELSKVQIELAKVQAERKREAAELRVDADMRKRGIVAGKAAPAADGTPGTDLRATLIELALLPDQSHYTTVIGAAKTVPLGEIGTSADADVNLAAYEPGAADVRMMVNAGYTDADARLALTNSKRFEAGLPALTAPTNGQVH